MNVSTAIGKSEQWPALRTAHCVAFLRNLPHPGASFSPHTQPFTLSESLLDRTGQKVSAKMRPSLTAPSFSMNFFFGIREQSFFDYILGNREEFSACTFV